MAELAGKFAGIVLVTVPEARADELVAALEPLAGVLDVRAHSGGEPVTDAQRFSLRLLGNDHPGIVRDLSHTLAVHGVSIDQLSTEVREAPMAGGMLFEADAVLEAPASVDARALAASLEELAGELMVELDLELEL